MGPIRVMVVWIMTVILLCGIIMAAPADNYGEHSDKLSRYHDLPKPMDILPEIRKKRAYGPIRNNYRLQMIKKCILERRSGAITEQCRQFLCANGQASLCATIIEM